jgi:hypothetical protein
MALDFASLDDDLFLEPEPGTVVRLVQKQLKQVVCGSEAAFNV